MRSIVAAAVTLTAITSVQNAGASFADSVEQPVHAPAGIGTISMLTANEGMAIGGSGGEGAEVAWIGRWNGTAWQRMRTPQIATDVSLNGIVEISAHDAWAVGVARTGDVNGFTLHWNGRHWRETGPAPTDGYLASVSASSATDVWSIGSVGSRAVAYHFDGGAWSAFDLPAPEQATSVNFTSASASGDDVWAVGQVQIAGRFESVVDQWNGTAWSSVDPPQAGDRTAVSAVSAVSSGRTWVVGSSFSKGPPVRAKPLTARRDGSSWTVAKAPSGPGDPRSFTGVSAISSHDVWAVGEDEDGEGASSLVEHWNGQRWKVVEPPNAGTHTQTFSVSALSDHDVWTSGEYYGSGGLTGFLAHWDGDAWTIAVS